jgi:hypothetical protein
MKAVAAAALVLASSGALAQDRAALQAVQAEVSIQAMRETLEAINHDRTSGKEGERKAAQYLTQRLQQYGVRHTLHELRAYLSWPIHGRVSVEGPGGVALDAITHAFGASTPATGVSARAVFLPRHPEDDAAAVTQDVRGAIVVAPGLISPASAWRAQQAGAAGLVHVNDSDVLHEMIATTVWGTPTTESAERIPTLPVASIGKAAGERLAKAAARGPVTLRLTTKVDKGWATLPLVVAEVPGRSAEFVLVATHLDAWYTGMTDTGGTVASVLEMARVLQRHESELARGFRFAWWPGHSFGRYAGSAWFADRFNGDLDRNAVAYTNLDGAGRRGSRLDAVYAGGWPGIAEYASEFAMRLTGKQPTTTPPVPGRFRPGRDSDSAFQGIGIPEVTIGVPGPSEGHPDVEPGGLIRYWHTAEDTLDKLDLEALALDTRYRIAQLYDLGTRPVAPLRLAPLAQAFITALAPLLPLGGRSFDLRGTFVRARDLQTQAERFDAEPPPTEPGRIAIRNRLAIHVTHRLNSILYTRGGRFDQDPAMALPVLPLLARATELAALSPDSDARGFLETELVRRRNQLDATLAEATEALERWFAAGRRP